METAVLNVLLFLIIAVAGFGILAIFFMIVFEKTRDIGILKSLGATGRGIMGIFLATVLSLGVVGASVGLGLGLLFVRYINEIADLLGRITGQPVFDPSIYYFQKIPTIVDGRTVAWIVLGAMAIAVLASILPARRAARSIRSRPFAMSDTHPMPSDATVRTGSNLSDMHAGAAGIRARRHRTAPCRRRTQAMPRHTRRCAAASIAATQCRITSETSRGPLRSQELSQRRRSMIPVLQGVELSIYEGEFVSIIGPSGCGKTTLLHLLATLDAPDSGEICFEGHRIDNVPSAGRDILRNKYFGMVFQFYHLLPELTTLENVLAPAMIGEGVLGLLATSAHLQRARSRDAGTGRPGPSAQAQAPRTFGRRNAAHGHRPGAGRAAPRAAGR